MSPDEIFVTVVAVLCFFAGVWVGICIAAPIGTFEDMQ
jgi:hypothetical protein